MATFQPPPTHADPVVVDEVTGKSRFNPIWLKWFLDAAKFFSASGGASVNHEAIAGLLGGVPGGHYHVTQTQAANLSSGISVTITTAKLTALGANGSMTFTNGILTAQTQAT